MSRDPLVRWPHGSNAGIAPQRAAEASPLPRHQRSDAPEVISFMQIIFSRSSFPALSLRFFRVSAVQFLVFPFAAENALRDAKMSGHQVVSATSHATSIFFPWPGACRAHSWSARSIGSARRRHAAAINTALPGPLRVA